MTRTEIRYLQKQLNAAGYGPLVVDGIYGSKTAAAYARFEARQDLPAIEMHGERVAVEPPLAVPAKPWWQSRTVIGLAASGLALLASRWGYQVDDAHLTSLLMEIVQFAGLVLAFFGTVTRQGPIDPTLVARVGTRDVRLPVRSHGAAGPADDPRGVFRDS